MGKHNKQLAGFQLSRSIVIIYTITSEIFPQKLHQPVHRAQSLRNSSEPHLEL
jgi:hypothetical protein